MKELVIQHFSEILAIVELIVIGILAKYYNELRKFLPAIVAGIVDSEKKDKNGELPKKSGKSQAKLQNALKLAATIEPALKKNSKLKKAVKWIELLVPLITPFIK